MLFERRADPPVRLYDRGGVHRRRHRRRAGGRSCPFVLRRSPILVADPRSLHGRRLWRAQARARAALHPVVRHRHRIRRSRWWRASSSSSSISARSPACARSTPSWCRWRRSSARASGRSRATSSFPARCRTSSPGSASACPMRIGAAVIAELISSNRGLGYLVQVGAMNFDTTQVLRRDPRGDAHRPCRRLAASTATERLLLRWRPPSEAARPGGGELSHGRGAAPRNPQSRQALSRAPGPRAVALGDPRPDLLGRARASSSPSSARRAPGKSTLLNMIAQIDVGERRRDHLPGRRRSRRRPQGDAARASTAASAT